MNLLIVGGAGYVGGATTDILSACGVHDIRVYDSLVYEESYRKPVGFVYGDVRDLDRLLPQLEWADAVAWLAARVGDMACALDPEASVAVNQEALRPLAERFHGRIVFLSTCSVYGAQHGELDETAPTNPLSVYAATKFAAEKYLAASNAVIFRLGTLFGIGDLFSRIRLDLVLNTMVVKAHFKRRLSVFGGEQYRPLLHVRDAARAIVDGIFSKRVGVYNLKKENLRMLDLAEAIRLCYPDLEIERGSESSEDQRNYRVSSARAEAELRFAPSWSVAEGVKQMHDLLVSERLRDVNAPRYWNSRYLAAHGEEAML